MRRNSTAIVIAIAVALAAVIVVASHMSRAGDEGSSGATSGTPSAEHRAAPTAGRSGTVDVAAAAADVTVLERARSANPGNVRIMLGLGDAYVTVRRSNDAEAVYRDVLAASPGHPNALAGLAMVWHARGDDERAVRLLDRVLRAFPDHQQAQYDLAVVLFSGQDVTEARAAWVKAAEIDPASELGRASQDFVELLSDGGATP